MKRAVMMMLLSGLVGFLLVLTAEARIGYSKTDLCHETVECLHFDLICKTDEYEVRHIESLNWVTASEKEYPIETGAKKPFERIQKYLNGANQNGTKMDIVTPFILRIPHGNYLEPLPYLLHMLPPAKYQENPPHPTDEHVTILTSPNMNVYVRGRDGAFSVHSDNAMVQNLASSLDSVGANYKKNFHFAAAYSSPLSTDHRYTEVMFVAVGEPVCN